MNISFDLAIIDPSTFMTLSESELISLDTNYVGTYTQEYDDSGTVIYDANDIKVVSKGIESDNIFGQSLNFYIENNTDKTIIVQSDNVSVNGFMITTLFSSTVLPSTKIIGSMTFLSASLDENGITEIENIEVNVIVIDESSFSRLYESNKIMLEF